MSDRPLPELTIMRTGLRIYEAVKEGAKEGAKEGRNTSQDASY
jgi:hypothetical protein